MIGSLVVLPQMVPEHDDPISSDDVVGLVETAVDDDPVVIEDVVPDDPLDDVVEAASLLHEGVSPLHLA